MEKYTNLGENFNVRLETKVKNGALVSAREKSGLKSATEAAKLIGISLTHYCRIESMQVYPSEDLKNKICDFYRGRGIFLLEEDVFPEELKQIVKDIPKKYVMEREIPRQQLISLSGVSQRLLPYVKDEVEKNAISNELDEELNNVLKTLTEREEKVIKYRFGLYGEEPKTLEEVGEIYNINRERVRQIEAKALRKLRHPDRTRILKHQINDRESL